MKNDRQSELVKKALSSSVRAISNDPNIEITFTPDNTQQSDSDLVQIPIPSREPKNNEIFELRGIGDSKALKIKYHDKDLHLKNLPKGDLAIEVYNAIERVRYESIGSKKLSGVSDNLSFALEKSYENVDKNENDLEERNTLSDAIRLFLREQMTGSKPPKSANKIYKKWKNFIKEHGSNTIKDLSKNIYDQKSYSLLSKKLLSELNLIKFFHFL